MRLVVEDKLNYQSEILNEFKEIKAQNRWSHSVILSGNYGFGSLELAKDLMKLLWCDTQTADFCNQCAECRKVDTFEHPNLILEFPTVRQLVSADLTEKWRSLVKAAPFSSVRDWMVYLNETSAQANINSKNTRELIKRIMTSPLEEKSKVVLIWGADYLGKTGNVLLKSIEEPPEDTYIIMLLEQEESMLSTILSRSQVYKLKPVQPSIIASHLIEKGIDSGTAEQLAYLSDGSLNNANNFIEESNLESQQSFVSFMRLAFKGSAYEIRTELDETIKKGKSYCKSTFDFGLKYIEAMLILRYAGADDKVRLEEDIKVSAQKLSRIIDLSNLEQLKELVERVLLGLDRNANIKILLNSAAFDIHLMLRRALK